MNQSTSDEQAEPIPEGGLTALEVKETGLVNDVPRYKLLAHFKNAQGVKLISFAAGEDVGQLRARLSEHLPSE